MLAPGQFVNVFSEPYLEVLPILLESYAILKLAPSKADETSVKPKPVSLLLGKGV